MMGRRQEVAARSGDYTAVTKQKASHFQRGSSCRALRPNNYFGCVGCSALALVGN